ncbi:MAG: arabinogalactan endo-1,4-beta-galactosidase [Firmicutes bacterium]|nr:arabinogalactan endo-1,4-beta-galactosidase [Bacillota bacterium]
MRKKKRKLTALILAAVLAAGQAGCGDAGADMGEPGDSTAGANMSDEDNADNAEGTENMGEGGKYFIKGADISSLQAVEDYGGSFYDFEGKKTDPITFLMENGCNYFRLRIWNDPTMSFDAGDYCDLEHTKEMAARIKQAGGDYLLDFHYSDWWADPNNQTIPAEWASMSEEEMVQAVYDYTAEVLNTLAAEDAYPDMVQIGNEIGNGMLWSYGTTEHPDTLAAFLNSGIKAVRDTTPKGQETQIMIHVETGGSKGATEKFFSAIEEHGVTDYDVVGLSYYPYWHGTFSEMRENVINVYEKFGKQVVLAETAYPFTTDNADDKQNMVSDAELAGVGFEAGEENQRLVLELIMNTVAGCEGGLGIFYWEPVWLAVDGAGVSKGSGNEWENQALFDFEGKALSAIRAFGYEPGTLDDDQALLAYPFEAVEIDRSAAGKAVREELPPYAKVLYLDGTTRDIPVEWDLDSRKDITETRCAYQGKALDFHVSLPVILADTGKLNNLDFEEGDSGWNIQQSKSAGRICNDGNSYPHSGEWSFHFWNADEFDIDLYQAVKIDESGEYRLQVWSQGVGGSALAMTLYIADSEGNEISSQEFTNMGWDVWQHPIVTAQLNAGDEVRIGVRIDGGADDWGTLDEFSFYTGEPAEGQTGGETDAGQTQGQADGSTEAESAGGGIAGAGNILQNSGFESGENGWGTLDDITLAIK